MEKCGVQPRHFVASWHTSLLKPISLPPSLNTPCCCFDVSTTIEWKSTATRGWLKNMSMKRIYASSFPLETFTHFHFSLW